MDGELALAGKIRPGYGNEFELHWGKQFQECVRKAGF